MGKSLSHSAQTLAALHYRFWCHTSPVLCMKQKIILKLGFNHFKIKFLLGNIINPCRTGWLFRMSSSYTFLFAETDRHVRFVRFPKFQPLTPTSSYNTLPTKIQNFTLIMGWQLGCTNPNFGGINDLRSAYEIVGRYLATRCSLPPL